MKDYQPNSHRSKEEASKEKKIDSGSVQSRFQKEICRLLFRHRLDVYPADGYDCDICVYFW